MRIIAKGVAGCLPQLVDSCAAEAAVAVIEEDELAGRHGALALIETHLHAAISRFARMDAPLIGAINGTAGGGRLQPHARLRHHLPS